MTTPYTHEPSWFAALLYISGKPTGMIMRDAFEPVSEKISWCYADGALDKGVPSSQLAAMVEDNGLLLLSALPNKLREVKAGVPSSFTLLEESDLGERVFLSYCNGDAPINSGVPEAMVYRDGGAIGDVYHAAAVAEEFAKQGFRTCFMAMDKVRHVFASNPFITWFVPRPMMEDKQLHRFLEFLSRRVKLFVVLDWSIEGMLLKKEILSEYFWSKRQREAMCAKGYARNVSDMAGLTEVPVIRHYASQPECAEATGIADGRGTFVFIQLAGSSDVHKWNPHTAKLIVMLLARTSHSIYVSYTSAHAGLAYKVRQHVIDNYGETDRLVMSDPKRSYSVNIEIAKRAACVVGPETGLMVGLSHETAVRKVLLVSHSAVSNFDDWVATTFLTAGDRVSCWSCHRLHTDFRWCRKDEATGASACQAIISAKEMFEAITRKDDADCKKMEA